MPTYNHAPYIRQALEGCLSQETGFPFEILVCDDHSTDGTVEILQEYARRYPDTIVLSLQPSNSQGPKNFIDGLNKLRGTYVAFCEGDDFWKSPGKLERQVRFLEEHPDFSVCCHKVEMLLDGPCRFQEKRYIYKDMNLDEERIRDGVFYADEAVANYYFQTSSMVFRWRFTGGLPNWFRPIMLLDHFLFMLHAVEGKIKYFPDDMSVWRRHEGGYTWLQNLDNGLFFQKKGPDWIDVYEEMDRFFSYRFTLQIRERILLALRNLVANCLRTKQMDQIRHLVRKYRKYFDNPVLENAVMLDGLRLALPETREFFPPWFLSSPEAQPKVHPAAQPEAGRAAPSSGAEPSVGGFFEPEIAFMPEARESVWDVWTTGGECACFANADQALFRWLWANNCVHVWLPVYSPPLLPRLNASFAFTFHWYGVSGDLTPRLDFLDRVLPGHAVLTFAYFGKALPPELEQALLDRPDVLWIEDRRHALWPGAPSKARAAIYSPADLLGVPDGGILVGRDTRRLQPSLPASASAAFFEQAALSLKRLEQTGPYAADDALLLEHSRLQSLRQLPATACSRLTVEILKRVPLKAVAEKRRANWKRLAKHLKAFALWPQEEVPFAPYAYPALVSDDRPGAMPVETLSAILAARGIFSWRCWHPLNADSGFYPNEESLSKNMILLPCDQRYGEREMERIAREVLAYMAEELSRT
jgi:glycosyltransferase involved in cell wall biosynthesis